MNLLMLVVLGALAWFSFESGMEFFGFLVVLAGILLLFTERPQQAFSSSAPEGMQGQPIVIESGGSSGGTREVNLKVKKWKDRWLGHPNEYIFMHIGIGLSNIARSILYIFGIEKDKK